MPTAESLTRPLLAEYHAARHAAALLPLDERGVLAATGPQRQKFLHNILSNDIEKLQPGQGRLASLMDVKGHLLALMRVLVTPDAVLLEMPRERIALVKERLLFYKVGAPVRFEERDVRVLALVGPRARSTLAKAGVDVGDLASEAHVEGRIADAPVRAARAGDLPDSAFVLHLAPEQLDAVQGALIAAGALKVARATLDVLRIEDGRPFYGADVTEEYLLHETGLLREYHSSSKGCYIGQEVVARLEGRGGNVSRLLRGLRLGAPADVGEAVLLDGRIVGRLTTSGVSPQNGAIALAFLHRSAFVAGAAVEVAGKPATVVTLPFEAERPA
jgi:folate-binding protein YgfZ